MLIINKRRCLWFSFVWIFYIYFISTLVVGEKVSASTIEMPDTTLWLEIVINGKPTGEVIPVEYQNKNYWLTAEQLDQVGLSMLKKDNLETIAIDKVADIHVNYNSELQQLHIDLPSSWLPQQHIVINRTSYLPIPPQSSLGALFNYDFYYTSPEQKEAADNLSLWTEQRIFDGFGIISNTGIYHKSFNGNSSNRLNNRYLRFDTYWRYSDPERMLSYRFGDVITDALPWTTATRIGGFQIARNFSTRPDLITYPLPQFAGDAAVPSTVDLYINNYKMDTQAINPGPFTIETQPYINGAGNATIVTTDALGRQVSTSAPFYVASSLLREGLTDYSLSLGVMRQNYGLKSADYSNIAVNSLIRYGATNWLTLEGKLEGAQHLVSTGVGANMRVANWGVVNLAVSGSRTSDKAWHKNSRDRQAYYNPITGVFDYTNHYYSNPDTSNRGNQLAVGYSYNNNVISINAQRIIRSKGYADLSNYRTNYLLSRRQDQLTTSLGLGRFGTLGAGYFAIRHPRAGETKLLNVSWNTSIWRNLNIYASINKEISNRGISAQIMLTMPLDDWGTASISSSRDINNQWVTRTNWSRTAPLNGGLGWNLAIAEGNDKVDKYRQADITWRSDYFETRAGMYGNKDNYTRWGEVTGSIVAMGGDLYATNTIYDAFALVSTNGFADVPVFYENQLIGKTNNKGKLLVPTITSWYPTKLSIDPLDLPAEVEIPATMRELSVREQSGLMVEFKIKQINSINFIVIDNNNKHLPRGSLIKTQDDNTSWVGWDGAVWMQNIETPNKLNITLADTGKHCSINLPAIQQKGIIYLEPQVCQ